MKPRFRWKKHKTPEALLRAYSGGMGVKLKDISFVMSDDTEVSVDALVANITRMGMWAFTETRAKPPAIHFWHDGKRRREDLALLFGHEIGHNCGKKLKSGWPEERRADEYGEAVVHALRRLDREKCRR